MQSKIRANRRVRWPDQLITKTNIVENYTFTRRKWWNKLGLWILFVTGLYASILWSFSPNATYGTTMNTEIDEDETLSVVDVPISDIEITSTVLHVALEFGPAAMGGLGTAITDLASLGLKYTTSNKIAAILPYYRYLRNGLDFDFEPVKVTSCDLMMDSYMVGSWAGRIRRLISFSPHVSVRFTVFHTKYQGVDLYLISPGDLYPLNLAFSASNSREIYDVEYGITHEWQHLFYFKAVAIFSSNLASKGRLTLHLHGATAALTPLFMDVVDNVRSIYTMHDYSYEFDFHISKSSLSAFIPKASSFETCLFGDKIYTSAIGISSAKAVTVVSPSFKSNLIKLKHETRNLVLSKLKAQMLYEITNGISINRFNPFIDPKLIETNLCVQLEPEVLSRIFPKQRKLKCKTPLGLGERKKEAKRYLSKVGLIRKSDYPLFIFIGRFTLEKGIDKCLEALEVLNGRAQLVLMGQPLDHLFNTLYLKKAQESYPDTLTLIDSLDAQKQYGMQVRLAADYVLLPSKTEGFGLVALESLLFGSAVITTGVGGLSEFLVDRNQKGWNSYFISDDDIKYTINLALSDHLLFQNDPLTLEKHRWTWILQALNHGWWGKLPLTLSGDDRGLVLARSEEDYQIDQASPIMKYLSLYTIIWQ